MRTYAEFLYTLQKGYAEDVWGKNRQTDKRLKECDS